MSGGGSSPSTNTVVQQSNIPQFVQDYSGSNMQLAGAISNTPYQAYQGQRIADFTPNQQQSFDMTKNAAGSYQPAVNAATSATQQNMGSTFGQQFNPQAVQSQNFNQADIGSYMNPFLQQSLTPQLQMLQRQQGMDQLGVNQGATSAGAFGDARQGVADANNKMNYGLLASNLIGQGYNNAFNSAAQNFQTDASRNLGAQQFNQQQALASFGANAGQFNTERSQQLQGASQLANLGAQQQALGLAGANAVGQVGAMQQGQNQQNLTTAYNDFLDQRNYPIEMLNVRESALSSNPYNTTRLTTSPPPNTMAQNLGAFGALAGGAGTLLNGSGTKTATA